MNDLFKKFGEKNDQEKAFCDIEALYTDIDLRHPAFSNEILADILFKGRIDADQITKSISQNAPFRGEEDERALDKLYYLYELDEEEFKQVRAQFESDYQQRAFKTPEDIFASFSRRCWLSENKFLSISIEKISEQGDEYLHDLLKIKSYLASMKETTKEGITPNSMAITMTRHPNPGQSS